MTRITLLLAAHPTGRIALHIACMLADQQYAFHFAGIAREVA